MTYPQLLGYCSTWHSNSILCVLPFQKKCGKMTRSDMLI